MKRIQETKQKNSSPKGLREVVSRELLILKKRRFTKNLIKKYEEEPKTIEELTNQIEINNLRIEENEKKRQELVKKIEELSKRGEAHKQGMSEQEVLSGKLKDNFGFCVKCEQWYPEHEIVLVAEVNEFLCRPHAQPFIDKEDEKLWLS